MRTWFIWLMLVPLTDSCEGGDKLRTCVGLSWTWQRPAWHWLSAMAGCVIFMPCLGHVSVMRQCEWTWEARSGRSGWTAFWEAGEKLAQCHLSVVFPPARPNTLPTTSQPPSCFHPCSCASSGSYSPCFFRGVLFYHHFLNHCSQERGCNIHSEALLMRLLVSCMCGCWLWSVLGFPHFLTDISVEGGYVVRVEEGKNVYMFLTAKREGKTTLLRQRGKMEDDIEVDLIDVGWEGVAWINLAQNWACWWAVVNTNIRAA